LVEVIGVLLLNNISAILCLSFLIFFLWEKGRRWGNPSTRKKNHWPATSNRQTSSHKLQSTVKPAQDVTSIKQSPVLKGRIFLVLA